MAGNEMSQAMDAVFMTLGWRGRYQLLQLFQLVLCIFSLAFHILSIVFIGKMNNHRCRAVDNMTSHMIPHDVTNVTYGACSVTWLNVTGETVEIPCPNGLQFDDPVEWSMMSEWSLVCENEALADVSQTLLLSGMMVGAVLFTSLADRYGRKPVHVGCHIAMLCVGIAIAFVPSFGAFLPLRFFLGAFQQGTGLTSGILSMEILPARRRFVVNCLGSFLWAMGMVVLAFLAFLMRYLTWRYLQLLLTAFSLYAFLQIWFTDESLRWLMANGKVKQAERILKKAARLNGVSESDVLHVFRTKALGQNATVGITEEQNEDLKDASDQDLNNKHQDSNGDQFVSKNEAKVQKSSIVDFCRNRRVFICFLINAFAWIVNAMTYYGLSMTSVTLARNMYLGFFLSAVVETPCFIAVAVLVERLGRRKMCEIFHIMAGLSLLLSVTLSSLAGDGNAVDILIIALSLLGKFSISVSFAVLFMFTPELFPTNLRNLSLGMASMAGRIGGMVAPYSRTLIRHYPWAPGTMFGVCCLILPVCMRILPETCGRELPQTIEQMIEYMTTPYEIAKKSKSTKMSKKKEDRIV